MLIVTAGHQNAELRRKLGKNMDRYMVEKNWCHQEMGAGKMEDRGGDK